ncbi:MAG: alpha/beta hydrolase family protein [Pirellulales bacterium]
MYVRALIVIVACFALASVIADSGARAADEPSAAQPNSPKKSLPLPGETFTVNDSVVFVIQPDASSARTPTPWVWYAPTLPGLPSDAERWMFERFKAAGIAIAGIDVGESYGSPAGRAKYTSLYQALVSKRKFSPKPVLLGRSRGGLMLLCWACENADKVGGFAGIYPVCNLASYPGIEKAAVAYGLSVDELRSQLARHNPPDRLQGLAKAGVPMFAIHGDADEVVPLEENSGLIAKRYAALGGKMDLVVSKGQGHNMWSGFFECPELVTFVIRCSQADDE